MSRKQSNSSGSISPYNDYAFNPIRIIKNAPHQRTKLLKEIEVEPYEQRRISLGRYAVDKRPKGFSLEFTPDPDPDGSMVTTMTDLGTPKKHELILHIANYGSKTVKTTVRQIQ